MFKGKAHAPAKLTDRCELFGGEGFEDDGEDDFGAMQRVDAEHLRVIDEDGAELLASAYLHGNRLEQRSHFVRIGREIDADIYGCHGVTGAQIGDGGDQRVGDDVECAVAVANGGFAQSHGLDGSGQASDFDGIAHIELVFNEDEDPVEHVPDDVLCCQADGYTDYSGGSEERREVEAKNFEDLQACDETDYAYPCCAGDAGDGFYLINALGAGGMAFRHARHVKSDKPQNPIENNGDDHHHHEVGKFEANELLAIDDPLVEDLSQETPFCKDAPSKGCQKRMHAVAPVSRLDCAQEELRLARFLPSQPKDAPEFEQMNSGGSPMPMNDHQAHSRQQCGAPSNDRRGRRRRGRTLACLAALVAFGALANPGQNTTPGMPVHDVFPAPKNNEPPDANARMVMNQKEAQQKNFEAVNAERKKQIGDDSAHLLKLANELKAEVDKTDKDTLSIAVIRKADEIEKLAHIVKEKMKLTVGSN